jgi:hypothetical protein
MYQPTSYRRYDSLNRHPPYGLFLDPHGGQHNWTAASSRVLFVFATVVGIVGSILLVFAFGPH